MKCAIIKFSKLLLFITCTALAYRLWTLRKLLYELVPVFRGSPLGDLPLDISCCALLLFILFALAYFLSGKWHHKHLAQRVFLRAGLKNSAGEIPKIISIRDDKNKSHGKIIIVANKGVSIPDMDAKVSRLEASLNGRVYCIEYGRTTAVTLIYLLPRKYDLPTIISTDTRTFCEVTNLLVVGNTGSGKSYCLLSILASLSRYLPEVSITVCDYKHSSFASFSDTPNFYGYENVAEGIRTVYHEFSERLAANDPKRNKQICVLLVDEYGALISAQNKKTADELKAQIANMLFMGRSLGIYVLIGIQRADSEHFKAGARDQFKAILALGNLSKEQKQMLFSDCKDSMSARNGIGEGYLLLDGQPLERVKIAKIRNLDEVYDNIRKAMCR